MTLSLGNVTFDCADPLALASFWSEVTGLPVNDGAGPSFASLGRTGGPSLGWLFIAVHEPKTAKNRVHLDLLADDRAAEVARLVGLGATHVSDVEDSGHEWSVLTDPEGNEFCVAPRPPSTAR